MRLCPSYLLRFVLIHWQTSNLDLVHSVHLKFNNIYFPLGILRRVLSIWLQFLILEIIYLKTLLQFCHHKSFHACHQPYLQGLLFSQSTPLLLSSCRPYLKSWVEEGVHLRLDEMVFEEAWDHNHSRSNHSNKVPFEELLHYGNLNRKSMHHHSSHHNDYSLQDEVAVVVGIVEVFELADDSIVVSLLISKKIWRLICIHICSGRCTYTWQYLMC